MGEIADFYTEGMMFPDENYGGGGGGRGYDPYKYDRATKVKVPILSLEHSTEKAYLFRTKEHGTRWIPKHTIFYIDGMEYFTLPDYIYPKWLASSNEVVPKKESFREKQIKNKSKKGIFMKQDKDILVRELKVSAVYVSGPDLGKLRSSAAHNDPFVSANENSCVMSLDDITSDDVEQYCFYDDRLEGVIMKEVEAGTDSLMFFEDLCIAVEQQGQLD